MPLLFALFFALLLNNAGAGPFGQNLIKPPTFQEGGATCLDPNAIDWNAAVLPNIPKPDSSNLPFPATGDCRGTTGSCPDQPNTDYVLAASNVKVEKIWPNPPTTRLYKQKIDTGHQMYNDIKDSVYRASCNDWCLLDLPYGGTFHCDFIFLLKPEEKDKMVDRDPLGNGQLEKYPQDGALFDILIRKGATIPDYAGSPRHPVPVKCGLPTKGGGLIQKIFGQEENFIDYLGQSYIFAKDGDLTKINTRTKTEGRVDLANKAIYRGTEYEVFQDLNRKLLPNPDLLFLVLPQIIDQVDDPATAPGFRFDYLEFRKSPEVKPKGKTLQLGTFSVPVGEGWFRHWVDESKPAIYLYPEKPTRLRVVLNPAGKLLVSDPPYDPEKGWEVIAYPDGTIKHLKDTSEVARSASEGTPRTVEGPNYPYLYYEANLEKVFVKPEGFIVEGKNLVKFFKETLPKLGLNDKETQDFIDYWMGRLNSNQPYYFINFLDNDQIEALEPLSISLLSPNSPISPIEPRTTIRLRAYFKPLEEPINITPQVLPSPPKREGFTLVEWGGILDE